MSAIRIDPGSQGDQKSSMFNRLRFAISAIYALALIPVSAETPTTPVGVGHAKSAEAKADFTTAADPKFKQPGARKLALKALTEFP